MTIVASILLDHADLLMEARRMCETADPAQARVHCLALKGMLVVHSVAEESVVYRAVDALGIHSLHETTLEREVEHSLFDHLLIVLSRATAGSALWHACAKAAHELLVHHIENEHRTLLPLLEQRFDPQRRASLATRFDARKAALSNRGVPLAVG